MLPRLPGQVLRCCGFVGFVGISSQRETLTTLTAQLLKTEYNKTNAKANFNKST